MSYVVLAFWIVQSAVGLTLLVSWLRHASGRGARQVIPHVATSVSGLVLWIWFIASGAILPAWLALIAITIGNTFGDIVLLGRVRRFAPQARTLVQRYGAAIGGVFRGQLSPRVWFHALFAGVVYFTCLGVCIGETVAAG
ncbi:hypothetical protein [Microbacterium timonense]|jgi:hypothetical protein|uniref:hypothetical protein n=1 Tax=Microbacterium timonense TaxID=2086576 RepID=UPI0011B28259|nr:hypothetical protein [Microbacterium timonense]